MNAHYFSHDHNARNDPKLLKVRQHEDWFGYGLYWGIVEILYEQGGRIRLDEMDAIAFDLRISLEKLGKFFNDYPDLFTVDNEFVTSESALRRMNEIKSRSKINKKNAEAGWVKRKSQSKSDAIRKGTKKGTETGTKTDKKEYIEGVFLKESEYDKLVERDGKDATDWMLQKLSNYKLAHGKKYKSDYGAINSWVRDKYLEQNKTSRVSYD